MRYWWTACEPPSAKAASQHPGPCAGRRRGLQHHVEGRGPVQGAWPARNQARQSHTHRRRPDDRCPQGSVLSAAQWCTPARAGREDCRISLRRHTDRHTPSWSRASTNEATRGRVRCVYTDGPGGPAAACFIGDRREAFEALPCPVGGRWPPREGVPPGFGRRGRRPSGVDPADAQPLVLPRTGVFPAGHTVGGLPRSLPSRRGRGRPWPHPECERRRSCTAARVHGVGARAARFCFRRPRSCSLAVGNTSSRAAGGRSPFAQRRYLW